MRKEEKEYRLIPYTEDDEATSISASDIFLELWKERKIIVLIVGVFAVYGILSSLATPEEFTSTSSVMPNVEEGSRLSGALQQFSGLLGNVGIPATTSGPEIDASLYPEIIFSTPAMYELIYSEIYSPSLDSTLTVKDYMLEHREVSTLAAFTGGFLKYTVHLPFTIIRGGYHMVRYGFNEQPEVIASSAAHTDNSLQDGRVSNHRRLTVEEFNFIRDMKDNITLERNTDTGLFKIEVSMPEPEISAQTTQFVIDYLTNYITEYRTEKLVRNLNFIEARYSESLQEFKEAQNELAEFRDRNVTISTARMHAEQQRLESEYQLKFELLNSIAQKREEARINLEEKTPVFNILEPVSIPTNRSRPARVRITITYIILGAFVAIFWIYLRRTIFYKKA